MVHGRHAVQQHQRDPIDGHTDNLLRAAIEAGHLAREICAVTIPQKKKGPSGSEGDAIIVSQDEHPRETSLEALAKLKGVVRPDGVHWQLENLSVHDGSLFPTSVGANPQLSVYGVVNRLAQGLVQRLTGQAEAQALEPELACVGAVLSPSTGIIDSHALMYALLGDAETHGAQ